MREILFRGKRKDNGEWVCGYLWVGNDHTYITPSNLGVTYYDKEQRIMAFAYEVDPSTVCQYTGLTDKNGKKIFEGDIVVINNGYIVEEDCSFRVEWDNDSAKFRLYEEGLIIDFDNCDGCECKVIGNIFDSTLISDQG